MRHMKAAKHTALHHVNPIDRRDESRASASFGLMYSGLDDTEVLMGDGTVVDLSRGGLGIRGNHPVKAGMELTLFLYLPDRDDPLFVFEACVARTNGRQFGVQFKRLNLREGKRLQAFLLAQLGR